MDVGFEVGSDEIVAIIGSNGAGKSTLLGAISGLVDVWGGRISFDRADVTGLAADRIVGAGIVQVPQGRRLFGSLTVEETC